MPLQSINPTTGKIIATFQELTDEQINEKIETAHRAFQAWKSATFDHRKSRLLELANILRVNKEILAKMATEEMGKPIQQARAEVEKCVWVCEYYAQEGEKILAEEQVKSDASESYVRFEPMGVLLAVMPWNFPYWQVFRFLAPALMAGNVGVLKHASNTQGCAQLMEKVVLEADFPEGVFQNLIISSSKVESVIRHQHIAAVSLTGSEGAGKKVAAQAGSELKKTVLELGGSDPFIVLEDADMDLVMEIGPNARLQNCGQSCIAAKRFIVVKERMEEFLQRFQTAFEAYAVGDPADEKILMGPLVNEVAVMEIERQVQQSVEKGATVVTGGKKLDREGFFYAPTILKNVKPGMPAYEEEMFGPVASVIEVEDEEQAIEVANSVPYGLGASLWTKNIAKAKTMAEKIESGSVFVNGLVKSDPRLPFGGVKMSGYGRELSVYGIREFVNVKTVWIK